MFLVFGNIIPRLAFSDVGLWAASGPQGDLLYVWVPNVCRNPYSPGEGQAKQAEKAQRQKSGLAKAQAAAKATAKAAKAKAKTAAAPAEAADS